MTTRPSLLGRALRNRIKQKLIDDGATDLEAEDALSEAEGDHPLLDFFVTYGLPFLLALLKGLIASKK